MLCATIVRFIWCAEKEQAWRRPHWTPHAFEQNLDDCRPTVSVNHTFAKKPSVTQPVGPCQCLTCSLSSVSTPCRITRARPQSSSISKVREHTLVQLRHPMQVNSSTNTCTGDQRQARGTSQPNGEVHSNILCGVEKQSDRHTGGPQVRCPPTYRLRHPIAPIHHCSSCWVQGWRQLKQ